MASTLQSWKELRLALAEGPSELAFRAVCGLLETWPSDDVDKALAAADRALASWPDEMRLAPWTWGLARIAGEDRRSWPLVRSVQPPANLIGASFRLEDVAAL